MKTQYYTAVSLDGYIADADHSLDWLHQFGGDDESSYPAFIRGVGAIAMGSTTYEWVLKHHVYLDPAHPKPWPYDQPTWVFSSRSLPAVPGADIRFASGDVAPVHAEMREVAAGKNIWIVGGGELAARFHDRGLLDEIIVTIAPVILGGGAPLFTRKIAVPPLRVLEVRPQASGLTEMRLEVPKHA
ncbi:MAG TPA: dihydrofolate reductase family protein [Longimicrobiales bacterium]|nr:dihydrofolate reductase family protein [Longimicrobiales bacterium]